MSNGYKVFLMACFFVLPFAIAAAFKYTDWMGWPAAIVFGMYWLGAVVQLGDKS